MAKQVLTSINYNQNEFQNARIQNLAAAPASPVIGQVYYDTGSKAPFVYNGTAWVSLFPGTGLAKFSQTLGDGTTTSFTVTHGLNTQDVVYVVRQAATPFSDVECDISVTSATTLTVAFASAPTSNAYRVTVIG